MPVLQPRDARPQADYPAPHSSARELAGLSPTRLALGPPQSLLRAPIFLGRVTIHRRHKARMHLQLLRRIGVGLNKFPAIRGRDIGQLIIAHHQTYKGIQDRAPDLLL